jgi:hypothetical protein
MEANVGCTSPDLDSAADAAAPLDALLIDAARGSVRRFLPDASTAPLAAGWRDTRGRQDDGSPSSGLSWAGSSSVRQRWRLLGGASHFMLSTSGYIAAMVNPPGNAKRSFLINKADPADPEEWLSPRNPTRAVRGLTSSLAPRAAPATKRAPEQLGGGLTPLVEHPARTSTTTDHEEPIPRGDACTRT